MKSKLSLMCLLLVILISGCSGKASIESQLIGTWAEGEKATFSLHSDNTFELNGETGSWGILLPTQIVISGTWRLVDKDLILTITKSSAKKEALEGLVQSESITDIDRNSFRTLDRNGEATVYTRIK